MQEAEPKAFLPSEPWETEEAPTTPAKQPATYKPRHTLAVIAGSISWSTLGDDASAGDLQRLDRAKRDKIGAAAELPLVRKVAAELCIPPVVLVIGLMARFMASRDRHAARIACALLGGIKSRVLVLVAELLELADHA